MVLFFAMEIKFSYFIIDSINIYIAFNSIYFYSSSGSIFTVPLCIFSGCSLDICYNYLSYSIQYGFVINSIPTVIGNTNQSAYFLVDDSDSTHSEIITTSSDYWETKSSSHGLSKADKALIGCFSAGAGVGIIIGIFCFYKYKNNDKKVQNNDKKVQNNNNSGQNNNNSGQNNNTSGQNNNSNNNSNSQSSQKLQAQQTNQQAAVGENDSVNPINVTSTETAKANVVLTHLSGMRRLKKLVTVFTNEDPIEKARKEKKKKEEEMNKENELDAKIDNKSVEIELEKNG